MIGAFYQRQGIKVIPTISWAEPGTFKFCFDGIEKNSIVSISTIGVKRTEFSNAIWKEGVDAMLNAIEPSDIIVYGGEIDYDYGKSKVHYFENTVLNNWKEDRL